VAGRRGRDQARVDNLSGWIAATTASSPRGPKYALVAAGLGVVAVGMLGVVLFGRRRVPTAP